MIALLLLLVLCVASCKTQKATTLEQVNQQTNETETIDEQRDSTTSSATETNVSETSVQNEVIDQTVEVTEWSAPDSLGNQYAVRTVRTSTNIHRGTQNDKQTTVSHTADSRSQTVSHTERTKSETTKTKAYRSERTEIETPGWVHTTILGIIFAVAIIVLIILKRYHIL